VRRAWALYGLIGGSESKGLTYWRAAGFKRPAGAKDLDRFGC
jgi:hypothetical protein